MNEEMLAMSTTTAKQPAAARERAWTVAAPLDSAVQTALARRISILLLGVRS
jgi:hypothetical protein